MTKSVSAIAPSAIASSTRTFVTGAVIALAVFAASAASAQTGGYTGPSSAPQAGGYTGPSTVPTMTVKEVLDSGRDDQKAILRGRVISHDGGENYTFEDATGRISAEIDRKKMPAAKFDANTNVELLGEIERDNGKVEFDVDEVRIR